MHPVCVLRAVASSCLLLCLACHLGFGQGDSICRGMLDIGRAEQRLVLTADRLVRQQRDSNHVYLVQAKSKREQFEEVVRMFRIELHPEQIMSRCTFCGGTFGGSTVRFEDLPVECTVPEAVKELHSEFWVCTGCQKVFWQGDQYKSSMQNLTQRCQLLNLSKSVDR
jgi:uncharacterized protein